MESIPQKQCTKCKLWFARTNEYFHKNKSAKDGLKSVCKPCNNRAALDYYAANTERMCAVNAAWRAVHPDKMREYQEVYVQRHPERVKETKMAYAAAHRKEQVERTTQRRQDHPEQYGAHKAVQIAVNQGKLASVRSCVCELCGNQACHYHHWSYAMEHWLDVTPLCHTCHRGVHMGVIE